MINTYTFTNDRVHENIHFYDSETEVSSTKRRMIFSKKKIVQQNSFDCIFFWRIIPYQQANAKKVFFVA